MIIMIINISGGSLVVAGKLREADKGIGAAACPST